MNGSGSFPSPVQVNLQSTSIYINIEFPGDAPTRTTSFFHNIEILQNYLPLYKSQIRVS